MTVITDEDVERQAYGEFVDELGDTLAGLQVLLENVRSGASPAGEAISRLRRDVLSMKSQVAAVSAPMIKVVTHRLDEYLAGIRELGAHEIADILVFLDKINLLLEQPVTRPDEAFALVRTLPAKRAGGVDFKVVLPKNVEVLLVVPEKALSHFVEREMAACGYRVSNARSPFEAFEAVARTRPDLVVASMELETVSGIDLANALAAMSVTQSIPFALLTSYDWGHPKLRGLPPRAAIIRKGAKFGDDLAETLARFNIT